MHGVDLLPRPGAVRAAHLTRDDRLLGTAARWPLSRSPRRPGRPLGTARRNRRRTHQSLHGNRPGVGRTALGTPGPVDATLLRAGDPAGDADVDGGPLPPAKGFLDLADDGDDRVAPQSAHPPQ